MIMTNQKYHFIEDILNAIDQVGANYVSDSYHHLAQFLAPTLYLLASIYIAFLFFNAMRGATTYDAMLLDGLKLVAILTGALHYNYFCLYLYDIFTNEPMYLFKAMAVPNDQLHTFTAINQAVDDYLNTGLIFASKVWKMGGLSNISYLFFGACLFIFTWGSSLIALGLFALAKLVSAALFALSPLWIGFAMFDITKDIFTAFIRQLTTYALVPVIASAILMMTISVTNMLFRMPEHIAFSSVFNFILLSGLQIYLLMHVYGKAAALAAGFALKGILPALQQAGANITGAANIATGGKLGRKGMGLGAKIGGSTVGKGAAIAKNYIKNRFKKPKPPTFYY